MDFQKFNQGLERINESERTIREGVTLIEGSGIGLSHGSRVNLDQDILRQFEAVRATMLQKSSICHVVIARIYSRSNRLVDDICYWDTFSVSPHIPRLLYRVPDGDRLYSVIADAENCAIITDYQHIKYALHIDADVHMTCGPLLCRAFAAEDDASKWCESRHSTTAQKIPLEDPNKSTKLTYTWL